MTALNALNHDRLVWAKPLFPYQKLGVDRLVGSTYLLLSDEMGLGKTIQPGFPSTEPPNQCEFLRFSGVLARQAVARTAAATWTVGNGG